MDGADRLQLVTQLGSGGQGDVWEVRDPALPGRRLALKRLRVDLLGKEAALRFLREAELLARLRHPGVVTVHAAGRDASGLFLVTDLVEGATLEERVRSGGLPPAKAAQVMAAVCDAVDALHRVGIVHRDLKPSNVLLRPDGRPVLLDFGLAREADSTTLTTTGELIGTPAYMAPEQARDARRIDPRSDVYALGATLYALLAGRPPFSGPPLKVIAAMQTGPSWPAGPDPALDAVCRRAMALQPVDRFASAGDLAGALRASSSQRSVGRRLLVAGAGALLLAGAAAVAAAGFGSHGPERPSPRDPAPPAVPATPSAPAAVPSASRDELGPPRVQELGAPDAPVEVVFLSRRLQGRLLLVTASGQDLQLWALDPDSGALEPLGVTRLPEPRPVAALCAAPDGSRVWAAQGPVVWAFALSPDGRGLGKPLRAWRSDISSRDEARALAVSADGRLLGIGMDTFGTGGLAVWDLVEGKPRTKTFARWPVLSVEFSPDGGRLAGAFRLPEGGQQELQGGIACLAVDEEREWTVLLPKRAYAVRWTPAGELLAGLTAGTLLRLVDRPADQVVGPVSGASGSGLAPSHVGTVRCLARSADGRRLYSGSWSAYGSELRAWSLEGVMVQVCPPAELAAPPATLAVSPDDRWLATGTARGTLELRRVR